MFETISGSSKRKKVYLAICSEKLTQPRLHVLFAEISLAFNEPCRKLMKKENIFRVYIVFKRGKIIALEI